MERFEPGAGRRWEPWAVAGVVAALSCAAPMLTWILWSPLEAWLVDEETTRVIGNLQRLMLAFVPSIVLLHVIPTIFWRRYIMRRQKEAVIASTRIATHKEWRERVATLFSKDMASRVASIESLASWVNDLPLKFHVDAARNLCSVARHPLPSVSTPREAYGEKEVPRVACPPDARAAVFALIEIMKGLARTEPPDRKSGYAPDLSGADFAGLNFKGAELTRVTLVDANLPSTNFQDANLAGASLAAANLAGADLKSATLVEASLAGACLAGTDLMQANLARASFAQASLKDSDLAGADLTRANLTGVDLTGASLTRATLTDANLSGATMEDAKLADAIGLTREMLRGANPSGSPASLPPGLFWPFEKGADDRWHPKPE